MLVALVLVIASFGLMLAASVLYTNYVAERNEHEWCELLTFYDDYYREHPPQNELQKRQAELMRRRVEALHCK